MITEYIDLLRPLQHATERLEGRGKSGKFGAIYEVIPVFGYLLAELETRCRQYDDVDFNAHAEAPEDHLAINLKAAWRKADEYYSKLDDLPAYYAAVCLHSHYKHYCKNSWADKAGWLDTNNAAFRQLWALYKPVAALNSRSRPSTLSDIDDAIDALVSHHKGSSELNLDEYEQWRKYEPMWTKTQYNNGNVVRYWIDLAPKYPNLSRLAIDILAIPASSCECERLFSELGDLLEPRRRKNGAQLLAALQLIRSWARRGFTIPNEAAAAYTDEEMTMKYGVDDWDEPPQ